MTRSAAKEGASMTIMVALMRAREDADRSAARLQARGFATARAPATQIHASGAAAPTGPFDAIVATSAKAVTLLAPAARSAIVGGPLFAVGGETARAANEAGFALARQSAPDVAALTHALRQFLASGSHLLYLAGRDRRSALEDAMREAGHRTSVLEVYAAEARPAWGEDEARAVADCGAALHYSARSAALAVDLAAGAGLTGAFRAMTHVCLAPEVGEPLRAAGASRLIFADAPIEERLIDALERAFAGQAGD
jgi:uroporphyrinogen-III synthase